MVWPIIYVSETFWKFWFLVIGVLKAYIRNVNIYNKNLSRMRKELLVTLFVFSFITKISAQVGIGTNTPDASAELELSSANKGFFAYPYSINSY